MGQLRGLAGLALSNVIEDVIVTVPVPPPILVNTTRPPSLTLNEVINKFNEPV